jgi:hypothetical protein
MLAFALLLALLTGPGFGFCAPPPDTCAAIATLSLSDEQFGKPVLHLTATKVDVAPPLPAYCDVRDWKLRSVVCEGALAVKVSKKQYTYKARFNKQDLKDITTGNAVNFRVYAIVERDERRLHHGDNDTQWLFERHGYRVAFEGSGTVRVVE